LKINKKFLSNLGYLKAERKSSFTNFTKNKKQGVIRIGCFGDSFTYGDETKDGYEYPALLKNIFKEQGFSNIEVINIRKKNNEFFQTNII
jgi:hypothetical protein